MDHQILGGHFNCGAKCLNVFKFTFFDGFQVWS